MGEKFKFQSRTRRDVNVMKDFQMPIFLVTALIHTKKYTFRETLRCPLVSYLIGKNTFSPSLEHPPFNGQFSQNNNVFKSDSYTLTKFERD